MIHNKAVDGEAQSFATRSLCDTTNVTNDRSACQFMSTSIENREVLNEMLVEGGKNVSYFQ